MFMIIAGETTDYTNKRSFDQLQRKNEQHAEGVGVDQENFKCKLLRSSVNTFNWKQHCFLCGKIVFGESRKHLKEESSFVMTLKFRETIIETCHKRNDAWSVEVLGRLNSCNDLPAEEARYHRVCLSVFLKCRSSHVGDNTAGRNHPGRHPDNNMLITFEKLCDWLEEEDQGIYTIAELQIKMQELSEDGEVYSLKHIKRKLEERYAEHIFFAEVCGRKNVICFRNMASHIITNQWYDEKKSSIEDESERIIVAAAKLIRAQIREMSSNETYPGTDDFSNIENAKRWIPSLLKILIENIVCNEIKQVSICHSIVQGARQRSLISPILFGVGVSLDHAFGSRWLLDLLSRLGFSISYDEVKLFKQSVVQNDSPDTPQSFPQCFTQWSGDNLDHNIITLDGSGTFHGMGIISMSTPCNRLGSGHYAESAVPRLSRLKSSCVVNNRGIPILGYTFPDKSSLSLMSFKPISHLNFPSVLPPSLNLELAWKIGILCLDEDQQRPNWSGFMEHACKPDGDFRSSSDIRMLPIIDLNPNVFVFFPR